MILLNANACLCDYDGGMGKFEMKLAQPVDELVSVSITLLGRAVTKEHIFELMERVKMIEFAVGRLFVCKGVYECTDQLSRIFGEILACSPLNLTLR